MDKERYTEESINGNAPFTGDDWSKTRSVILQLANKVEFLIGQISQVRREIRMARERPPLKRRCKYCRRKRG